MTKEEVAEILRCEPSTVPRIDDLKSIRVGNRRGVIRWKKEDVIEYINNRPERKGVKSFEDKQKKGYRKMGISSLLSWEELQKTRLGYSG